MVKIHIMLNNCILFNHRGHGEHGGDLGSTQGIRGANGAGKTRNSASKLDRFSLFFLPIPAHWDLLPCSRITRPARELLTMKLQYVVHL